MRLFCCHSTDIIGNSGINRIDLYFRDCPAIIHASGSNGELVEWSSYQHSFPHIEPLAGQPILYFPGLRGLLNPRRSHQPNYHGLNKEQEGVWDQCINCWKMEDVQRKMIFLFFISILISPNLHYSMLDPIVWLNYLETRPVFWSLFEQEVWFYG